MEALSATLRELSADAQLTGGRSLHLEEWRLGEGRLDLVALVPPALQGHQHVLLADGSEHLIDGLDWVRMKT